MKNIKRILCLILAITVVLSCVPVYGLSLFDLFRKPHGTGYRDIEYDAPVPRMPSKIERFPRAYSSVTSTNDITPAKYQGNDSTCWAFSSVAPGETSWATKTSGDPVSLSTMQLVYYFFQPKEDPLGNANDDTTVITESGKNCLTLGGNHMFSLWAMASWADGAKDEALPYTNPADKLRTEGTRALAVGNLIDTNYGNIKPVAHLQNAIIMPVKDNFNEIKSAIVKYGAVATSYFSEQDGGYYSNSHAYYYPSATGTNHAVTIVGWNDDYPVSNFGTSKPNNPGAWLVKNSWGTDWGTDGDADPTHSGKAGYFWLSYEDTGFVKNDKCFVFDYEPAGTYKYNYQYDRSNGIADHNFDAVAATYTVKGLTCDYETLDAVGIGVNSANARGTVYVYKHAADDQTGNPTNGELIATQNFNKLYAGYYTIPLTQHPVLTKGDAFSVVIKFNTTTKVFCDENYDNGNWIGFRPSTEYDKTYRVTLGADGKATSFVNPNTYTSPYTIRLKAYTNDAPQYQTYTVTCDPNYDSLSPTTETKNYQEKVTLANPTRPGYTLLGWATNSNATYANYKPGEEITVNRNLTLYAVWVEETPIKITEHTFLFFIKYATIEVTGGSYQGYSYTGTNWINSKYAFGIVNIGPFYVKVNGQIYYYNGSYCRQITN